MTRAPRAIVILALTTLFAACNEAPKTETPASAPAPAASDAPQAAAPDAGAVAAAAAPVEESAQPTKIGDWGILCSEAESGDAKAKATCRIVQSAFLNMPAKDGEEARSHRVMLTVVSYIEDSNDPVLTVVVPLGIFLPPGMFLDVEGYDQLRLVPQFCDGNGCVAVLPMKEQLVEAFKKKEEARITFYSATGKASGVRISLAGFGDALAKLN